MSNIPKKTGLSLIKEVYNQNEALDHPELYHKVPKQSTDTHSDPDPNGFVEDFDRSIFGTKTYVMEGFD